MVNSTKQEEDATEDKSVPSQKSEESQNLEQDLSDIIEKLAPLVGPLEKGKKRRVIYEKGTTQIEIKSPKIEKSKRCENFIDLPKRHRSEEEITCTENKPETDFEEAAVTEKTYYTETETKSGEQDSFQLNAHPENKRFCVDLNDKMDVNLNRYNYNHKTLKPEKKSKWNLMRNGHKNRCPKSIDSGITIPQLYKANVASGPAPNVKLYDLIQFNNILALHISSCYWHS